MTTTIDKLSAIIAARTPGPWKAAPEGVYTDEEYIDCFSTSGYSTPNAAFVALMGSCADEILAVLKAAKVRNPLGEDEVYKMLEAQRVLNNAIAALEAKIGEIP